MNFRDKMKSCFCGVCERAAHVLSSRRKALCCAAVNAALGFLLLIGGYYADRLPWLNILESWQLYFANFIHKHPSYDDATFIDVGYAKEIITVKDVYGDTIGNQAITDRSKLYQFLKELNRDRNYKYIIMDVYFNPNDVSPSDSALFSLIQTMLRIVVGRDHTTDSVVPQLVDKSAYLYYKTAINATNFTRYMYVDRSGRRFLPLKAFEDLYPEDSLTTHGSGFFRYFTTGGRVCNEGSFITLDNAFDVDFNTGENYMMLDFTPIDDVLAIDEDEIGEIANDAIVVIGDYQADIHDTYSGNIPCPVITYRAFKTLEDGKHTLHWFWDILFWWVI